MKTTPNYGLKLPEDNDFGDVAVLNENTLALDGLLRTAIASAAEYSPAGMYAVGDYCTHGGKLWRCISAILAAEPWTPAHWAETNTAAELASIAALAAGKADKLIPSAAGNLAGLDANGNLTDSGKKAGDFLSGEAGAVTEAKLKNGAVTTPKLADGAVTAEKLDPEIVKKLNEDKSGCVLQITFFAAFVGRPYTVTAPGESYSGTVPTGGEAEVFVKKCNTTYTIDSSNSGGTGFSTTVTTGPYFGYCPVELTDFSATLRVTAKAGAVVTAVSGSNTYTATADGNELAIFSIRYPGTYAVTGSQGSETVSGSVNVTTSGSTYNLTLPFIYTVLEKNSWAKIREVSDADAGANYWKLGDKKAITINGKVGNTTFSNLTVYAFIIGFNHNAAREGNHRIHFQIGKTAAGVDICLVDNKDGQIILSNGYFNMNASNTNSGGWNGSQMRSTVLGSGSTPTSPAGNTLLAALPADLRAVMKSCTKYSDNAGGGVEGSGEISSTVDYLFLLAEWEYHGARTHANSAEKNYQEQYAYYKAGNSKIKYRYNNTAMESRVWVRSVLCSGKTHFCHMETDGSAKYSDAYVSYAVTPGFCA